MGDHLPVVDLGSGRNVLQVKAGTNHTCALLDNHQVKCWGGNSVGELGQGDTRARGFARSQMSDRLLNVDFGAHKTAIAISVGSSHSCALIEDGTLKCWGAGGAQLGVGDIENKGDKPGQLGDAWSAIQFGLDLPIVQFALGAGHTCAITPNQEMRCWGGNSGGELGLGDVVPRGDTRDTTPDKISAIRLGVREKIKVLSASQSSTCALFENGKIKCWGINGSGELGYAEPNSVGGLPNQMGVALPYTDLR
ncbi:MAG: hypothetical protein AABZ55_01280, partial [Bdellovibrionota bacterium]